LEPMFAWVTVLSAHGRQCIQHCARELGVVAPEEFDRAVLAEGDEAKWDVPMVSLDSPKEWVASQMRQLGLEENEKQIEVVAHIFSKFCHYCTVNGCFGSGKTLLFAVLHWLSVLHVVDPMQEGTARLVEKMMNAPSGGHNADARWTGEEHNADVRDAWEQAAEGGDMPPLVSSILHGFTGSPLRLLDGTLTARHVELLSEVPQGATIAKHLVEFVETFGEDPPAAYSALPFKALHDLRHKICCVDSMHFAHTHWRMGTFAKRILSRDSALVSQNHGQTM